MWIIKLTLFRFATGLIRAARFSGIGGDALRFRTTGGGDRRAIIGTHRQVSIKIKKKYFAYGYLKLCTKTSNHNLTMRRYISYTHNTIHNKKNETQKIQLTFGHGRHVIGSIWYRYSGHYLVFQCIMIMFEWISWIGLDFLGWDSKCDCNKNNRKR